MTQSNTIAHTRFGANAASGATTLTNKKLLLVFLLTILIPIRLEVAGLALSPTRVFLLILIIPLTLNLFKRSFGAMVLSDWFMFFTGVWMIVALVTNHGFARFQFAGITAVEAIGGYIVGRAYVRNEADFRFVFSFMLKAMVILLPFTIYENLTGKLIISDFLRALPGIDAPFRGGSARGRMGLERVYSVFDHPILWGLFCSIAFSNTISLAKHASVFRNLGALLVPLGIIAYSTFSSLSSAPLLSIGLQCILIAWGIVMGGRWKLFCLLVVTVYAGLDIASNRTPVTILFESLTFNSHTAWTRVAIFEYGKAAVMDNPIFGVGFNRYSIPHWLTKSVDNFWLLIALRFGLVGFAFWAGTFLAVLWKGSFVKISDPRLSRLRTGYLIALTGAIMTMITVHVWEQTAVFIMFYVGAGVWLFNDGDPSKNATASDDTQPQTARYAYSRFPPKSPMRASRDTS